MNVVLFVDEDSKIEAACAEMATLLALRPSGEASAIVAVVVGDRALAKVKPADETPTFVEQELSCGSRWDAWYVADAEGTLQALRVIAACAEIVVHPVMRPHEALQGLTARMAALRNHLGATLGPALIDRGRGRFKVTNLGMRVAVG